MYRIAVLAASGLFVSGWLFAESKTNKPDIKAVASPMTDWGVSSNEGYFETVNAMYDVGFKPDLESFKAANIGRCYAKTTPSRAIPTVYVIEFNDGSGQQHGPIEAGWQAVTFWNKVKPATYFDSQTYDNFSIFKRVELAEADDHYRLHYGHIGFSDIRQHGDYLVERLYDKDMQPDVACYYFKKILP